MTTAGRAGQATVIVTIALVLWVVYVWPKLERILDEWERRAVLRRQRQCYERAVRHVVSQMVEEAAAPIIEKLRAEDAARGVA